MAVIVELLNNQGKSTSIHKFTQSEIRLGRSYANDVILLDPHSCAEHAVLTCNELGEWQLRDLNSANGTLNSQGQRVAATIIPKDGQEFRLGKQRLRVVFSDAVVAPTRVILTGWQSLRWLSSVPLLLGALVLLALLEGYDTWLGALGEGAENWQRQLLVIPFMLIVMLLWPAILAMLARFRSYDANFLPQATLLYVIVAAWFLLDNATSWLHFNFSNNALVGALDHILPAILLCALFWFGFKLAAIQRNWLRLVLTLVLVSTYWLVPYIQSSGPNLAPQYRAEMLPQSFLVTSPNSAQSFLEQSEQLYQQVDEQAQKNKLE